MSGGGGGQEGGRLLPVCGCQGHWSLGPWSRTGALKSPKLGSEVISFPLKQYSSKSWQASRKGKSHTEAIFWIQDRGDCGLGREGQLEWKEGNRI